MTDKIKEHNRVILYMHEYRHHSKLPLTIEVIKNIQELESMIYIIQNNEGSYIKSAYATFFLYDDKNQEYSIINEVYRKLDKNVLWFEDFYSQAKSILPQSDQDE